MRPSRERPKTQVRRSGQRNASTGVRLLGYRRSSRVAPFPFAHTHRPVLAAFVLALLVSPAFLFARVRNVHARSTGRIERDDRLAESVVRTRESWRRADGGRSQSGGSEERGRAWMA
ncbi:hypothetical protein FS749_003848 [Ceratobasidium sp. UAMH 11750]|nr:hypothetical protein FS749_003848 [Ceratobasidium sp. UAMH 11750]